MIAGNRPHKPGIKEFDCFFFDFDGVIADSLDIKTRAFGDLFNRYGGDIAIRIMKYHKNNGGISRFEKFKYFYEKILDENINSKIINKLDKEYSSLVLGRVVDSSFIAGAMDFIKVLNRKGKACFVISATPQKEINKIVRLKKINHLFRKVVGSPRTKSENLKNLLQDFRIVPGRCIYFGDAKSDYMAAKENRVFFVGIVNKKSRELNNLRRLIKIKDFHEIKDILDTGN